MGEKNGPEKRQGLEAKNSVEDSIQKFTNKVLPGIFSNNKTGQKVAFSVSGSSSDQRMKLSASRAPSENA